MQPALIFLPSLSYTGSIWKKVSDEFNSEGYSTHLINFPEYNSTINNVKMDFEGLALNLKAQLSQVEANEVIIIGHSLGGLVATIFTTLYPHKVQALILVSTPLKVREHRFPKRYKYLIKLGRRSNAITALVERAILYSLKKQITGNLNIFNYVSFIEGSPLKSVVSCYHDLMNFDFSHFVKKIKCKTLIVLGSKDNMLQKVAGGTTLYKEFRNAKVVTLNGTHGLPTNNSQELYREIKNFITQDLQQ